MDTWNYSIVNKSVLFDMNNWYQMTVQKMPKKQFHEDVNIHLQ